MKSLIFTIFILANSTSCNSIIPDYCDRSTDFDLNRIPLNQPPYDLVQLKGEKEWIFSLSRAKIDSLIMSDFINVKEVGIGKNAFFLKTELSKYLTGNRPENILVCKIDTGNKCNVYFSTNQIDSFLKINQIKLTFYKVDEVWDKFKRGGKVPWCN